jgi:hypothetical protein
VLAESERGSKRIQAIEISNRRIRGSGEDAYLTASYKPRFSYAEYSTSKQAIGSHLWILQKRVAGWSLS